MFKANMLLTIKLKKKIPPANKRLQITKLYENINLKEVFSYRIGNKAEK